MHPNLENLVRVHEILHRLGVDVVYGGGATIGLYLDDFGAAKVRPTKDVDCIVPIEARPDYLALESTLRAAGLSPSTYEDDPLCRWVIDGVKVDILPLNEAILGFTNRFYRVGFATAEAVELPGGRRIKVLHPALAVATKIEAYRDRGASDPVASEDLEDIIALFDGCGGIVARIAEAPTAVQEAIGRWVREFLGRRDALDLIEGHLGLGGSLRVARVVSLLEQAARGGV